MTQVKSGRVPIFDLLGHCTIITASWISHPSDVGTPHIRKTLRVDTFRASPDTDLTNCCGVRERETCSGFVPQVEAPIPSSSTVHRKKDSPGDGYLP